MLRLQRVSIRLIWLRLWPPIPRGAGSLRERPSIAKWLERSKLGETLLNKGRLRFSTVLWPGTLF